MRRFLIILALIIANFNADGADKTELIVVGDLPNGANGVHWNIINKVYGDKYNLIFKKADRQQSIQLVKTGSADLFIGSDNNDLSALLFSEQHIDIKYPLHFLYDKASFNTDDFSHFTNKIIGAKKGLGLKQFLPSNNSLYRVDSIENIGDLIVKGRIDGAYVYSYNLRLADPKSLLSNKVIVPEQPIFVAFTINEKGIELRDYYEQQMTELINKEQLSEYFRSEIDYQHANLKTYSDSPVVKTYLIPKIFNQKTNQLDVTPWEVEVSKYFAKQLLQTRMEFSVNSFKDVKLYLSKNANSCAISVRQYIKANENVVFSDPFYAYLQPRIFVLKGSEITAKVNTALLNEKIKISELFKLYPNLKIAIRDNSPVSNRLKTKLEAGDFKRFILINEKATYRTLIQMLLRGRADAVILWPNVAADLFGNDVTNDLESYTIAEPLFDTLFTYIACHKDEMGHYTINKINELMKNDYHQPLIYSPMVKDMDDESAKELLNLLNVNHKNVERAFDK